MNSRIYADCDTNVKELRRETLAKQLQWILKLQLPSLEFFAKKLDGTVISNWIPIARVLITGPTEFSIGWAHEAASRLVVDREAAVAALKLEDSRQQPDWV